jgi:hypothetical protein
MGQEFDAADIERPAQDKVVRPAQRKRDEFAVDFGLNDSRLSLEPDVSECSGDLVDKARETPRTIPAHFRFAAITVIISHPKIGFACGRLDKKHSIRTDASMAIT